MPVDESINYIELPAQSIEAAKEFFTQVFAWTFQDYGPQYTAFQTATLEGGFYQSPLCAQTQTGSALIVLYSRNLLRTQHIIEQAGGRIVKPVFAFPGGQRFHFTDPNGNEYAVWSDQGDDSAAE